MKKSWTTRSALRSNELAGIAKAIAIMRSDDARDLFKKSFESQGYANIIREVYITNHTRGVLEKVLWTFAS
jgi:hypothetical protein